MNNIYTNLIDSISKELKVFNLDEDVQFSLSKIDEYDLPMFYWASNDFGINFKKCLDLNHINVRIQLLIKSLGEFSIGNQTGANDIIPRYTKSYIVPREKVKSNFINKVIYI